MLADGIKTYVIGFGGGLESPDAQQQLQQMAQWGGTDQPYSAATQADLEQALEAIVKTVEFDPCCQFNDCSENPEPTGGEGDQGNACLDDDDCLPLEACALPEPDAPVGMCSPAPCAEDSDCPQVDPPATCAGGECKPGPCQTDAHCPGTQVCEDGKCVGSGACTLDSDCSVLEACVDGQCAPRPCESDGDCPESQVCDDAGGVCVPDDGYGSYGSYSDGAPTSYGSYGSYSDGDSYGSYDGDSYGDTDSGGIGLEEDACTCSSGQDDGEAPRGLLLSALALLGLTRARRRRAARA
ncbi:MAG: hypothetical protein H6713_31575 [Myxococcales bacterium]|nr:hypothetical protein [Myxococcales bacterium]